MREYVGYKKLNGGPGGIKCPCCCSYDNPRKGKPLMRRLKRRVDKQRLWKELHKEN